MTDQTGQEKEGEKLKKEIEAILFAAGRKVSFEEIEKLCREDDRKKIQAALNELKDDYNKSDSPIFLIGEGDGWKMTVKERYLGLVKDVAPHTELNKALLETLAIIAWKHPVYQSDVVKIRGSTAYEHIKELVEMGFITKVKQGRSYILRLSTRFFDYFDLPDKESVKELFSGVESADIEKRREMGADTEEQKRIDESAQQTPKGAEGGSESGKLETYTEEEYQSSREKEKEIEKAEDMMETKKLGQLEVYEKPEEKKEDVEEYAEEGVEEAEAEDEREENKGPSFDDLMEEKEEGAESGQAEEYPGEAEEAPRETDEKQGEEQEKGKGRISKELEEFAGLDNGGDKEKDKEKEESEEYPGEKGEEKEGE